MRNLSLTYWPNSPGIGEKVFGWPATTDKGMELERALLVPDWFHRYSPLQATMPLPFCALVAKRPELM